MDTLHIYGQQFPHDCVCISGSQSALESLRLAIDKALRTGTTEVWMFDSAGEGYDVVVALVAPGEWDNLNPPYPID